MGACLAGCVGHGATPARGHLVAAPGDPRGHLAAHGLLAAPGHLAAPDHRAAPGDPRVPREEPCPCCYYRISSCDAAGRYTTGWRKFNGTWTWWHGGAPHGWHHRQGEEDANVPRCACCYYNMHEGPGMWVLEGSLPAPPPPPLPPPPLPPLNVGPGWYWARGSWHWNGHGAPHAPEDIWRITHMAEPMPQCIPSLPS